MAALVSVTIVLGVIILLLAWWLNGTWFGAAPAFWISWSAMTLSAAISMETGLIPPAPPSVFRYVFLAYFGAFVGSVAGVVSAGRRKFLNTKEWHSLLETSEAATRKLRMPYIIAVLVVGLVHFVSRWHRVDFDILRLSELRVLALEEGWTPIARLGSYISIVGYILVFLMGTRDAARGVKVRQLAAIWLASSLHGIAFGGRIWTLSYTGLYLFAYFLSRRHVSQKRPLKELWRVGALIAFGMWLFVLLGIIRQSNGGETVALVPTEWRRQDRLMMQTWIGVSLLAIGPHTEYAESQSAAMGELTFGYFALKAYDLGLLSKSAQTAWQKWTLEQLPHDPDYGFTWCVPPTAIPYLVLDYGVAGMVIALAVIIAILHWITIRWSGYGVMGHIAALLAMFVSATTIQNLALFTSITVVPLALTLFGTSVQGMNAMLTSPVPPRSLKGRRRGEGGCDGIIRALGGSAQSGAVTKARPTETS